MGLINRLVIGSYTNLHANIIYCDCRDLSAIGGISWHAPAGIQESAVSCVIFNEQLVAHFVCNVCITFDTREELS